MAGEYEPSAEDAEVLRRYKRARETEKQLLPLVRKIAVRAMRDENATVSDMAALTSLTDEVFRRLARENGIERKREPTVGYEVEAKRAAS